MFFFLEIFLTVINVAPAVANNKEGVTFLRLADAL